MEVIKMDEIKEEVDTYFGAWVTTSILGIGMLIAELLFGKYIPAWAVLIIALGHHIMWRNYVKQHANQSNHQNA